MMASLKALAWALNSPLEDELTRSAARMVLGASDPSMVMSDVFPILMGQKGIRAAIGHLSRAGADLEELSIPTATVCNNFPMSRQRLWPVPSGARWTLADLSRVFTRHAELLWKATTELIRRMGSERFVLLSGRATESIFPEYKERLGFDVDLWLPKLSDGLEALEIMVRQWDYRIKFVRLEDIGAEPRLAAAVRKPVDGYLVSVGIVTSGYHFFKEPLHQRSVRVREESQNLQAASPEDLLVMLAVRVQKRRSVQMVNIADAAMILRGRNTLDLSLVRHLTRKHGLDLSLGILLAQANARWPGTVPNELNGLIDAVPRLFRAITSRALQIPDEGVMRRLENRLFDVIDFRRSQPASGWTHATTSVIFERFGRRVVRAQNTIRKRLGMSPAMKWTSSFKPLCGAAHREVIRHLPQCVGKRPRKRWENLVGEEIREAADRVVSLMPEDSHQCSQLRAFWKGKGAHS
jgi:hypothetical protein